jgi:hypothetical protein
MMRQVIKGSTDQSVVIRIVDATDGSPETAVDFDTSGLTLSYRREGGSAVSITPVTLSAANAAHSDGGIEHIGAGYYRVDPPDAAFATGANGVLIYGTCTGMLVIGCYVPLINFNLYSATLDTDVIAAASISTAAANKIRDAITAAIVETQGNYTVAQVLSLVLAGVFGRTNAGTFSTPNNGAPRAVISYTGNDRTSVTLSP